MSNSSKDFPKDDPYHVLGVQPTDDAATINKAYRKLALQLHPDKLQQQLSVKDQELAAERFQNIQIAKAFLTEPEHASVRERYDLQRASQLRREQMELERNKSMSEKRKRMRDELTEQENRQRRVNKTTNSDNHQKVNELKKEGEQLRQQYADKEAAKRAMEDTKLSIEDRQVRLKWSRKKAKVSPTEHSIADLMQIAGTVEAVEFLGSKGNAALVTFADPASCRSCVDLYADSEEMRATFVGKRKEVEELKEAASHLQIPTEKPTSSSTAKDWKLQRAAEREQLLREMESAETDKVSSKRKRRTSLFVFPPKLVGDKNLSPLQLLQQQEDIIFKDFLSPEVVKAFQLAT